MLLCTDGQEAVRCHALSAKHESASTMAVGSNGHPPVARGLAPERTGSTRGRPRDPKIDVRIQEAVVSELALVSYDKLRVDAVAKRAGVPLSTLYRRYRSKLELVKDAFRNIAAEVTIDPDLPFEEGMRTLLEFELELHSRGPIGAAIVRLFAEATLNAGLQDIRPEIRAARERILVWLRRCAARGEIPEDVDLEILLDLAAAVIPYRMLVSGDPIPGNLPDLLFPLLVNSVRTGHRAVATPSAGTGPDATDG